MKKSSGKTALLSVYDKTGVAPFAQRLFRLGFKIISTGKTAAFLKDAGVAVQEVSDYTGFPEIFEGRVKTLHPKIHAGILARGGAGGAAAADEKVLAGLGAAAIDLVVVNLYPFEEAANIENIDIGGPTLLRAAAKNFERVWAVCDPADYERVAAVLEASGAKSGSGALELRRELAGKVFCRTARYEMAIAKFFAAQKLRYGENPHQAGWFLPGFSGGDLWESLEVGKEISYNNILDADAASGLIREFSDAAGEPYAAAIIKHTNPCGVAVSRESLVKAFENALSCDPTSAFGGVVALNREVDAICAEALALIFLEVILAPGFSKEAQKILAKKKNLRLLVAKGAAKGDFPLGKPREIWRSAGGGLLIQEGDSKPSLPAKWETKTKRQPTPAELRALQFAWKVVKHVKSNAIVFSDEEKTLGIGAGQTSRIDSVKLAVGKMKLLGHASLREASPLVAASDAFFPFADNIEAIAQSGATAVIQPGGSVKDAEVIKAADRHHLAMLFTGVRHFRH